MGAFCVPIGLRMAGAWRHTSEFAFMRFRNRAGPGRKRVSIAHVVGATHFPQVGGSNRNPARNITKLLLSDITLSV